MKKRFMAAVLLAAPALLIARASSPFEEAVTRIMTDNPALMSIQAGAHAQLHEFNAENALPGPTLEFERLWNATEPGNNRWSAGVSQSIPWPGVFSKRKDAYAALFEEGYYEGMMAWTDYDLKVRKLLLDYVAAKQDHLLSHEIAAALRQLYEKYREAYDKGEATIIDVNKARIEMARAEIEDHNAEAQLKAYEAEIEGLAPGVNLDEILAEVTEYPADKLLSLDDYISGYDNSPQKRLADARVLRAQSDASLARAARLPGLSAGYVHAYEDGCHFNGFSVGVELPSWNFRSALAGATDRQLQASFQREADRTSALQNIRAEYARAESLRRELSDFGPAIDEVNNTAILRRALEGGELTLLSYLQETAYFVQAHREYIQLRRDYSVSVATLGQYLAEYHWNFQCSH